MSKVKLRYSAFVGLLAVLVTVAAALPAAARSTAPTATANKATDVGVSATTIRVAVVTDVDNPIVPGVLQGIVDGVEGWGKYINAQGGLACRKVVVKEGDSKLSPTDAANAVAAACGNSMATVGTTALFLQDVSTMNACKDRAGKATGLPDIAELQTEDAQQCSPVSLRRSDWCSRAGSSPPAHSDTPRA